MGRMNRLAPFPSTLLLLLLLVAGLAAENRRPDPPQKPSSANEPARKRPSDLLRDRVSQLPPPPEGVTDVFFDEFFRMPVGPKGLETTEKLAALDGKRVRILGHMVKQVQATPWTLLLSPVPANVHERDYGLAEDLPPNVVRVLLPRNHKPKTPYTPGLLLLTGRLEVGDREEPDGRHSIVRLHLDPKQEAPPAPTQDAPSPSLSASENLRR